MKRTFIYHLKSEFETRKIKNINYSLRAFARDLNIEPSLLSKILRKKISVTLKMLERLASPLGLSEENYKFFADQIRTSESDLDVSVIEIDSKELMSINTLYSQAILELVKLSDFKSDVKWIAKRLGIISEEEVTRLLDNLVKLKLLKFENDRYSHSEFMGIDGTNIKSKNSSNKDDRERFLNIYKDSVENILHSIKNESPEKRIMITTYIAMDSVLIEEANKKVSHFFYELLTELEQKSAKKDHVYNVNFSLVPITR